MAETGTDPERDDDPRRAFALQVVRRLREAGFEALWAGGCVRDIVLGLVPSDYDVATSAVPDRVMQLFPRTVPVGISFGVVRVLGPKGAGEVEVATFRSDGRYLDGRRPESVSFGSAREDAQRRDFTINGMFYDPLTGEVIDYVGGRDDLRAGRLRAIGDPVARFGEDKLRLIRAVRFAARFGFEIEPTTYEAIVRLAPLIRVVAAERIAQELRRMLAHPSRALGMDLAMRTGLLPAIEPRFEVLWSAGLWDETLRTLDALPADPPPSFPLGLAALTCNFGKTASEVQSPTTERQSTTLELRREAAAQTDAFARSLKLSNEDRTHVVWLVLHQAALTGLLERTAAVRKTLLAQPGIEDLLRLHRAIATARGDDTEPLDRIEAYLRELPEGPLNPPPLVSGADLKELGLTPGPRFADWLNRVREHQLNGTIRTREEAIALLKRLAAGEE